MADAEYFREYRRLNGDRIRAADRARYARRKDEMRALSKAYDKTEAGRAVNARSTSAYRARKLAGEVRLTEEEKRSIAFLHRLRTHMSRMTGELYHVDHVVPLARGGIHHPLNLRVIPAKANIGKGARLTREAWDLMPTLEAIRQRQHG